MSLSSAAVEAPSTVTPTSPPEPAAEPTTTGAGAAPAREVPTLWEAIKQNLVAGFLAPIIVVILGFSYMSLHSDIDRVEDRIDNLGDRVDQAELNLRTEMNSRFADQQKQIDRLDDKVDRLDDKVHEIHVSLTALINETRADLTALINETRADLTALVNELSQALATLVVRLEESGTIRPTAAATTDAGSGSAIATSLPSGQTPAAGATTEPGSGSAS